MEIGPVFGRQLEKNAHVGSVHNPELPGEFPAFSNHGAQPGFVFYGGAPSEPALQMGCHRVLKPLKLRNLEHLELLGANQKHLSDI